MLKTVRVIFSLVILVVIFTLAASYGMASDKQSAPKAELTMISWRTEDAPFWKKINQQFMKTHPNISVTFKPIKNTEYDSYIQTTLASGNSEDLIFSRSFDMGAVVYEAGYLEEIKESEISNIKGFPGLYKYSFQTSKGVQYAAPGSWVCHGFLYNKKIFADLGLKTPDTWNEFLEVCKTIKAKGIIPLAIASKDGWTLTNMMTSQILPNFVNGEVWRQKMLKGEDNFLNEGVVKHFELINKLKDYMPKGYEGISYTDTQQLFLTGKAAIFPSGSWEIGYFRSMNPKLELGLFPTPVVKKGDKRWLSFYPDSGYAINKKTKHMAEAKIYVNWLCGVEGAAAVANFVPGFFPSNPQVKKINDPIAKQWLTYVGENGQNLTIWWPFEKIGASQPDASTLSQEAMAQLFAGKLTPQQAAEYVQNGLAKWYGPFKK